VSLSIGDSIQSLSDTFFTWLPRLAAAVVILVIAWLVARLLRRLVVRLASKWELRGKLRARRSRPDLAGLWERLDVARLLGAIVFWLILLAGLGLALNVLDIDRLDDAVAAVWAYIPNVLAAIAILLIAALIAGAAASAITGLMGDTATGRIAATVVPILVLSIAVFMALVQLQIAVQIVTATYIILLGSIGLGAALAFGLGGRNAAQRLLDAAYERGQLAAPQVRAEMARGKERAQERADQEKERLADHPPPDETQPGPAIP
jgi:Mechanosensitive ion channel, conserved TM helix